MNGGHHSPVACDVHRRGRGQGASSVKTHDHTGHGWQTTSLKGFMVRNTYFYFTRPEPSMRIPVADINEFIPYERAKCPKIQPDLDYRAPHAGGRRDGSPRNRLYAGRRHGIVRDPHGQGALLDAYCRAGCPSSLSHRHERFMEPEDPATVARHVVEDHGPTSARIRALEEPHPLPRLGRRRSPSRTLQQHRPPPPLTMRRFARRHPVRCSHKFV